MTDRVLLNQVKFHHPIDETNWSILFLCVRHTEEAIEAEEFKACQPEILLESPPFSQDAGLEAGMIPQCAACENENGDIVVNFYGGEEEKQNG